MATKDKDEEKKDATKASSTDTKEESSDEEKKKMRVKVEEVDEQSTEDKEVKEKDEKPKEETSKTEEKATEETDDSEKSDAQIPSFSLLDAEGNKVNKDKNDSDNKSEEQKEKVSEKKSEGEISSDEVKKWLKDIKPEVQSEKDIPSQKGSKGKTFLIILIVIILLGAIAGGVYYYQTNVTNQQAPAPTPIPTSEEPTNTPTPQDEEVELGEYSVSILNGSGIIGEAGSVQEILEESGFENIDTGNADSYDYETTVVSMKEDVPAGVFDAITDAIGETYNVELSEETLTEDATFDVVIIVGTKTQ